MLVLYETPAGYALFKLSEKTKLTNDIYKQFTSIDSIKSIIKLKAFNKFNDTTTALSAATAICDNKLDNNLELFLRTAIKEKDYGNGLGVIDSKLGQLIKDKLGIKPLYDSSILELIRGIREYSDQLLGNISADDSAAVRLGLSHSLSRYKLKFSPDKVDTMIVQAISLLDELDKELNTYAMRVREWYGWHFPEMGKIINDNIMYSKSVQLMGIRSNCKNCDFSEILPEDIESSLKEAAEVSMGTDIATEDIDNIQSLTSQVIRISEYRISLYEYLKNRMSAIAPNLTCMVGELVGARLIAHAGSLLNLAKHPASTVQILGAEKALFRALKTKHDTPKYGLIYHASLVGQATPKLKGKISRMLAAKTALSIRMDALGDIDGVSIALESREKVEMRLRQLEGGHAHSITKSANKKQDHQSYQKNNNMYVHSIISYICILCCVVVMMNTL